jgi:glycosyltransferase involved in cell wall biosynthesis
VDDGSTDGTGVLAASLGPDVRVVTQANQGAASARNAGVAATTAEFIAFLDADDVWPPGRLALLRSCLAADAGLQMAIGRTQLVVEEDGPEGLVLRDAGAPWHAPVFGSTLIRRPAFAAVGPIDPALQPAEDMDWFIRAREHDLPTAVLRETTLLYRWHGASLTSGADPIRRNMLLALKRSLDRRRAGATGTPRLPGNWLPTTGAGGSR